MTRLVVDASVAIKWFVPEIYSTAARSLLDETNQLLAPDLLWSEFANILWKKVRWRDMDKQEAENALRGLKRAPLQIQPAAPFIELAFDIAHQTGRTVYDSLYVSIAIMNNCQVVTADRRLLNRMKGTDFAGSVLWIEGQA